MDRPVEFPVPQRVPQVYPLTLVMPWQATGGVTAALSQKMEKYEMEETGRETHNRKRESTPSLAVGVALGE